MITSVWSDHVTHIMYICGGLGGSGLETDHLWKYGEKKSKTSEVSPWVSVRPGGRRRRCGRSSQSVVLRPWCAPLCLLSKEWRACLKWASVKLLLSLYCSNLRRGNRGGAWGRDANRKAWAAAAEAGAASPWWDGLEECSRTGYSNMERAYEPTRKTGSH